MKNKFLQKLSVISFPIFAGLDLLATMDGVINFLSRFNIDATVFIPALTNIFMLLAISYLLWQHFKTKNEDQVLMNAALSFIVQKHLGSIQFNSFSNKGIPDMAAEMAEDLRSKMHEEWGNKKYDDKINELVRDYLVKLGYK